MKAVIALVVTFCLLPVVAIAAASTRSKDGICISWLLPMALAIALVPRPLCKAAIQRGVPTAKGHPGA